MAKYGLDYIPGEASEKTSDIPHGYAYWRPEWKIIDGKLVKPEVDVVSNKDSSKKEMIDVFTCNSCEFKTEHEPAMKRHVAKHKKESRQETDGH